MIVMLILSLLLCVTLKGVHSSIGLPNRTYVHPEHLDYLLENNLYEEFAKLFHIDDVNMVKPRKGVYYDNPEFNEDMEGGDMLKSPMQDEQESQEETFPPGIWKWNKVVPYVVGQFSSNDKYTIAKAVRKWNRDLSEYIEFVPYPYMLPKELRPKDFVYIFNGKGCFSYFGRVGGQQVLSLSAQGCLRQGTILHEMAHAVGIRHEQSRPDRDKYIKILFENIPEIWQSQYKEVSYGDVREPYDYYSVMHYPVAAPESNKPAFAVLQEGVDLSRIGQREGMTDIDKRKIKDLYK